MKAIFVHGGVSGLAKETLPSLASAIHAGRESPSALDAVEAAIRVLEDDPALNAGYGAVLNRDGELELDAGIADGRSNRSAGVANVHVRHPISLARRALDETPHTLITGDGAKALAQGMEVLDATTEEQQRRWEAARARGLLTLEHYASPEHVDTVGAVALDADGSLAAGSSTGGVFGKLHGRVGDAPVFGAGIYASEGAAVVGTGVGELFLATLASLRTGILIEDGRHPQEACESVIRFVGMRSSFTAGLLALDAEGRIGAAYRGESWAVEGPDGAVNAQKFD